MENSNYSTTNHGFLAHKGYPLGCRIPIDFHRILEVRMDSHRFLPRTAHRMDSQRFRPRTAHPRTIAGFKSAEELDVCVAAACRAKLLMFAREIPYTHTWRNWRAVLSIGMWAPDATFHCSFWFQWCLSRSATGAWGSRCTRVSRRARKQKW